MLSWDIVQMLIGPYNNFMPQICRCKKAMEKFSLVQFGKKKRSLKMLERNIYKNLTKVECI